jgi:hypothetical protein
VGFNGWAPFEIGIFIVYLIPETYRATDGAKQSPTDQASLSVSGLKIVFLSMNYNGVQARAKRSSWRTFSIPTKIYLTI